MKIYFLFIYFTLLAGNIIAQPAIQWQKTFGGSENEEAYSICLTIDGGYIIAGYAESHNGDVSNHIVFIDPDVWLIKLDSSGHLQWNNCFGGTGSDYGYSILKSNDGGFIIAGETDSPDGDVSGLHGNGADFWIVKTDSAGTLLWQKCYGGTDYDGAKKIIQTSDSGYLVAGYASSSNGDVIGFHGDEDFWVIKLNQNGSKQWSKALGGILSEEANACIQTQDGGFLISGSTVSNNGDVSGLHSASAADVWVVKLDSTGQLIWQKCYGGTSVDYSNEIIASSDGGFFVSATTSSIDGDVSGVHGQNDFWLFKADSIGAIQWQKCYGGAFIESSRAASATSDGGIVMVGISSADDGMVSGTHGFFDYWIVKVDSVGNYQWSKCLGGTDKDEPYSVLETPDGGFIIAGYTLSVDGDITFNHGKEDFWVVKLTPIGLSVPELQNTIMDLTISQTNDQLNLRFFSKRYENAKMFLFDITGKKVFEKNISVTEGINYCQIYCGGLAEGMYFVEIEGERNSQREKVFIR